MSKQKNSFEITRPIIVFCIILLMFIFISCSKEQVNFGDSIIANNSKKTEKRLLDDIPTKQNEKEKVKLNNNEVLNYSDENEYSDLSNIRNIYYGKYNIGGEELSGTFEIIRNSISFTPDNGHNKEIIHLSGVRSVDRYDYPNGNVDVILNFTNSIEKFIGVSDQMFSDILLYTTK